ncbi:MAG: class I SAM-dependent methyltransferase [Bacteroidota bacterium]|nr:class I SAM-dependent methyltransferase [Bacteroidota bacterium]
MLKTKTEYKLALTEENFSNLLPEYLQKASKIYFTPLRIAQIATQWLTDDGKKNVLDIGAGVGKFCVAGARYSDSYFHGIEYRPSLAELGNTIIKQFEIKNAFIQNTNILDVDFTNFDAFYLYNPFFENLMFRAQLNNEVDLSGSLYGYYYNHTEKELHKTKSGTRLVTFHGNNYEVPDSFEKIKDAEGGSLKLWVKK